MNGTVLFLNPRLRTEVYHRVKDKHEQGGLCSRRSMPFV